jgi:hypothetical protein
VVLVDARGYESFRYFLVERTLEGGMECALRVDDEVNGQVGIVEGLQSGSFRFTPYEVRKRIGQQVGFDS